MPKQNGIELYISRNDFGDVEGWSSELSKHLMGAREEIDQHKKAKKTKVRENELDAERHESEQPLIIQLTNLDDLVDISVAIHNIANVHADLYYYKETYYLDIQHATSLLLPNKIKAIKYQALEFGNPSAISQPVLEEHGQLIRETDAIKYFATKLV